MSKMLSSLVVVALALTRTAVAATCNQDQQRDFDVPSGPQIASAITSSNTLDQTCSNQWTAEEPLSKSTKFGSVSFNITRLSPNELPADNNCQPAFVNIIQECISDGRYWGGKTYFNDLIYEIHDDIFPANGLPPWLVTDDRQTTNTGLSNGPVTHLSPPGFSVDTEIGSTPLTASKIEVENESATRGDPGWSTKTDIATSNSPAKTVKTERSRSETTMSGGPATSSAPVGRSATYTGVGYDLALISGSGGSSEMATRRVYGPATTQNGLLVLPVSIPGQTIVTERNSAGDPITGTVHCCQNHVSNGLLILT